MESEAEERIPDSFLVDTDKAVAGVMPEAAGRLQQVLVLGYFTA